MRSKNKFKTRKNNKLRWLATDINSNYYTLGVLSLMIISLIFLERPVKHLFIVYNFRNSQLIYNDLVKSFT